MASRPRTLQLLHERAHDFLLRNPAWHPGKPLALRHCMTKADEIVVTFPGGRRVDAEVGGHVLHTDQPRESGGSDTAASPFQLFLASIGTCAGIYVQGFCAARGSRSRAWRSSNDLSWMPKAR